jgi:hypothetical protein
MKNLSYSTTRKFSVVSLKDYQKQYDELFILLEPAIISKISIDNRKKLKPNQMSVEWTYGEIVSIDSMEIILKTIENHCKLGESVQMKFFDLGSGVGK